MPQQLYINLPVANLARASAFYHALGFAPVLDAKSAG